MENLVEGMAGETEVLGENLPRRHFVHHKSQLTRPGVEPEPPRWEASDYPLQLWRGHHGHNYASHMAYFYASRITNMATMRNFDLTFDTPRVENNITITTIIITITKVLLIVKYVRI
jgi:hypothetical protein